MSKYGNKKTVYDGILYDSKKEAARAMELDLLLRVHEIKAWLRQPAFKIVVGGEKICTYRGDFKVIHKNGRVAIEDVKGMRTPMYRLKKKLMRAIYGIEIEEPEPNMRLVRKRIDCG